MCVIVAKYIDGVGWVGAKNRDRMYRPKIHIKKSFRKKVERLLMWDADTKWTEGVNQYGLAMIGSASGGAKDMKKDELPSTDPSPDGKKMRTALLEKTPDKALKSLIGDEIIGSTIVFTKDTCFEAGDKIVKEIANYYDERNNNPKLQGWYTSKGELVAGFYC